MIRCTLPALTSLVLFSSWLASAAAAPNIQNISPRGLRLGEPTLLTISGTELTETSQLLVDVPLINQTVKQASGNQVQIEVTVDPSAPPGLYTVRLANTKGISNAVAIGIDGLPQQPVADEIDARPVALHGSIAGGQTQQVHFTGKQGERIVIDVESRRLGAQLRPVVRLYDSRGAQIAWSSRRQEISNDARVATTLPADGRYTIELHDVLHRGAAPGFYRMKIGDLRTADFAMPAGVTRGQRTALALYSSDQSETLQTEFDARDAAPGSAAAPLPSGMLNLTGGQPRMFVSQIAEQAEQSSEDVPQKLRSAPIAVTGRLAAHGEKDQYQLPVTPGTKLRIELFSERLGSPLDGVVIVRNAQGGQLARGDDQASTADPQVDYTVPENVDQLVIVVKDLVDRGGDSFFYRLVVEDASRPDFSLAVDADRLNVPAGGSQILRVDAQRNGYDGPIELTVNGLPSDFQAAGGIIPAGQTIGLLSISAPQGLPSPAVVRVLGRAADPNTDLLRTAVAPEQPFSKAQPWMRAEIGLAGTEAAPIAIAWTNASDQDRLTLGGALPANVSVTRNDSADGKVRVRLLTTQVPPKKTVKQDDKDVEVDDVDRTLRLESEPTLDAATSEATVKILVPADLPEANWGVVLIAELLSADEKNVVFSTTTPVRRLEAAKPE